MGDIKRILQVVTHMNVGGIETMLMNYYRALDKTRYQFDFLVHRDARAAYDNEIEQMGGRIYRTCSIRPGHFFKYFRFLDSFMKEHAHEYIAIHSHLQENSGFALKYAQKYNIRNRVCTSHSAGNKKDFKYLFRIVSKHFGQKYITQRLACGIDAGKYLYGRRDFKVLPNAIDVNRFVFNPSKSSKIRESHQWGNHLIIGNISSFSYPKNHLFLIDIFSEILKLDNNAILVLVGDGILRDAIEKKIKELNIEKQVFLEGIRSNTDEYLSSFDIFLFPSLYEGLPVSVIEAQASGVKCVLSDAIDKNVDITGDICFLPLSMSPQEWAEKIISMKSYHRSNNQQKIMDAGYDVNRNIEKLIEIYTR